jgi:hypothetical protein
MADTNTLRLLPGYDPRWQDRFTAAQTRQRELMDRPGALTDAERAELLACHDAMRDAANSRFRTTADYRDHHFARCRALLTREGIDMPLPAIADDATKDDIDRVLTMVFTAIEVTNSENF